MKSNNLFKVSVFSALLIFTSLFVMPAHSMKFQVENDGQVDGYFFGGTADYTSYASMVVDGVSRFEGFNNHSNAFGDHWSFGTHSAGDSIDLVLYNLTTNETWHSDASKNSDGLDHLYYSTFSLPDGTPAVFVGWEDISGLGDRDFNDSMLVFTNISPIPEPETYAMFLAGLGLLWITARKRNPARFRQGVGSGLVHVAS